MSEFTVGSLQASAFALVKGADDRCLLADAEKPPWLWQWARAYAVPGRRKQLKRGQATREYGQHASGEGKSCPNKLISFSEQQDTREIKTADFSTFTVVFFLFFPDLKASKIKM